MGLFGKKPEPEPSKQARYVPPPHKCEDNILRDQQGAYVVEWCGRCDRVVRRVKDVPPRHG